MHDTNSAIGNSMPLTSKNKQTEKKPERPINPSNKFFVGRQTNEFIDLHVYVDYTTVQQPFSIHDCMTLSTSRDVILDCHGPLLSSVTNGSMKIHSREVKLARNSYNT